MSGSEKLVWVFGGVCAAVLIGIVVVVLSMPDIDTTPKIPSERVEVAAPEKTEAVPEPAPEIVETVEEAPEPEPDVAVVKPKEVVEEPVEVEEAPPAPVEELDVWSVLTNIDKLLPEGYVFRNAETETWEDMSEAERTRVEEDGISFRRAYSCVVKGEGMSVRLGSYGLVEADDAASAAKNRDVFWDDVSGRIGYNDIFITGRYCVYIIWRGEDTEAGETLFSNLKNAVGYEE